jgi:sugar phosphate isomerase/epimerase
VDTGNTFIAGQDPVAYLKKFITRVKHVHVKDVSASLAAAVRGGQTGIALSHCALEPPRKGFWFFLVKTTYVI